MSFSTKRVILISILAVYIAVIILFNRFLVESIAGNVILFVTLAIYLVLVIAWWRCPHCKRGLGRTIYLSIKYCPHCGEKLE